MNNYNGSYGNIPEFYTIDPRQAASIHYAAYPGPPMQFLKYEIITPHENDILMGRGGKNNQHIGNEKLRQLARLDAKVYSTATKKVKSNIARGLVMKVRQMQPPGRFLKRNPVTSEWEDVGDEYAREKASQVLRDALLLLPASSDDIASCQKGNRELDVECAAPDHLQSDADDSDVKTPAVKRQRLMTPATFPPTSNCYSSYATLSPHWHNQAPMTPTPAPPTLKRFRSSTWFERAAFFATPTTPTKPGMAIHARTDSNRSFGSNFGFNLSPTILSRHESLCASLAGCSLPGENFLLTSNHERKEDELSQVDGSSDEFFTDFF